MRKSGTPSIRGSKRSNSDDQVRMQALFERALLLIDSTVTGCLIAGAPPESFKAFLSYLFLHYAAQRSENCEALLVAWTSETEVWDAVVSAALEFVDEFSGTVYHDGVIEDLEYLRSQCDVGPTHELSEIEAKRWERRLFPLGDWLVFRLADAGGIPRIMAELALLIVWFKTEALYGDDLVDEKSYAIVRQNPSMLLEAYEPVLNACILGV